MIVPEMLWCRFGDTVLVVVVVIGMKIVIRVKVVVIRMKIVVRVDIIVGVNHHHSHCRHASSLLCCRPFCHASCQACCRACCRLVARIVALFATPFDDLPIPCCCCILLAAISIVFIIKTQVGVVIAVKEVVIMAAVRELIIITVVLVVIIIVTVCQYLGQKDRRRRTRKENWQSWCWYVFVFCFFVLWLVGGRVISETNLRKSCLFRRLPYFSESCILHPPHSCTHPHLSCTFVCPARIF